MLSEETSKLVEKEELLLTGTGSGFVIAGNWLSVEIFREHFRKLVTNGLCQHAQNESFLELLNQGGTIFPSQPSSIEESANGIPEPASTVQEGSDSRISAKSSNLNPDVLALMEKTEAYQHSAVSYDLQTMTINIDCDDDTEKEKIKEELFTAYREVMMGGKLKEHSVPVDDVQQATAIVDEYNKTFNHTYFKYDPEKGEIKCLSTDARQMQHVRKKLNASLQRTTSDLSSPLLNSPTQSVFIDLPKVFRRVTIKLGNIVDEDVDAIVNAANDRLQHVGGVAAAIDRASNGEVQKASNKLIIQHGTIQTGDAVATAAGGSLKCHMVIHAVGPMASQHKQNCGPLLKNACNNAMTIAERFEHKSISFPPISSGIYAVSKELVANVMLSALCSYKCNSPVLLTDVRIVIIDDPTYQVFLSVFHTERQRLESLSDDPVAVTTSTVLQPAKFQYGQYNSPPGFPVLVPAPGLWPPPRIQLYSHAVTQPITGSQYPTHGGDAAQGPGPLLSTSTSSPGPANPQTQPLVMITEPQTITSTSFVSTSTATTVTSNSIISSEAKDGRKNSKETKSSNDVLIDSFKGDEHSCAGSNSQHGDENITKDKKDNSTDNKTSESIENGLVGNSHTGSSSNSSVPTTSAAVDTVPKMIYPKLDMASDDPLSQHLNDEHSQGASSQQKGSSNGPKGPASFSAAVTMPSKNLPPTKKIEKKETESKLSGADPGVGKGRGTNRLSIARWLEK